jgi:hypothetical protein
MFRILTLLLLSLGLVYAKKQAHDPNGFFKERQWTVKVDETTNIKAQSQYLGEPVQRPNLVTAVLHCPGKKTLPMFSKKYCGINYMKVVAGRLEVLFLDFSSKDSHGYCTKKRIEYFPIPSCVKPKNNKEK